GVPRPPEAVGPEPPPPARPSNGPEGLPREGSPGRAEVLLEEITSAGGRVALGRRAVASAAREQHLDEIAGLQDLLGLGVGGRPPVDQHLAAGARLAPPEPPRREPGPVAQH